MRTLHVTRSCGRRKDGSVFQSNLAHLAVVMLDDLQVEEVVLVLATQSGVPTASLRNLKLVLRAEIIR